jgi:hypothetical protein
VDKSTEEIIDILVGEDKDIIFNEWIEGKSKNKIYEDRAELLNIKEKDDKIKFKVMIQKILECQYELQYHLNSIKLLKNKRYIQSKENQILQIVTYLLISIIIIQNLTLYLYMKNKEKSTHSTSQKNIMILLRLIILYVKALKKYTE